MEFVSKYHKSYGTKEEYNYRLEVFSKNYAMMMHHNMMNAATEGYHLGINTFADMTEEEYNKLLGYKPSLAKRTTKNYTIKLFAD